MFLDDDGEGRLPLPLPHGAALRPRTLLWVSVSVLLPATALGTELAIAPINNATGVVGARVVVKSWNEPSPFTQVRSYAIGADTFAVLLDPRAGRMEIYEVNGGALGGLQSYYQLGHRFSSMEVISPGGVPQLALHDLDDGTIRVYPLNGGTLGAPITTTDANWIDKDLFESYPSGANWYFFGYDRFSGAGRVVRSTGQAVTNSTWSEGWSHSDYLNFPNGGVYRALYKWADHPGDEGGWLKIDRVDANNGIVTTPYNNSNFSHGYTTIQFVRTPSQTFLFLYEAASGNYLMRPFNGTTLSAATAAGVLDSKAIGFDDYVEGNQSYALFLSPTEAQPLTSAQVDAFANSALADVTGTVPGHQILLNQHGKKLVQVADGLLNVPNDTPMTIDSHVNVGSVGKMFTTSTLLRLVEDGELDLDQPIIDYLPYRGTDVVYNLAQIPADVRQLTLRELVTQTSGLAAEACNPRTSPDDSIDCSNVLYAARSNVECVPGSELPADLDCFRDYKNGNWEVIREVLEQFLGVHTVDAVDDLAHRLWAEQTGMIEATCLDPPGDAAYYFSNPGCGAWDGGELVTTDSCAGGGWYLPGRELMHFLEDSKSEQILGPELTAWLMNSNLTGPRGDLTSPGWDSSPTSNSCKAGGISTPIGSASAHVCVFGPGDAEGLAAINTRSTCDASRSASEILSDAWNAM